MKVGLVLGAGGVVGAAWLIGALEALAAETGWDPTDADVVAGTSAGSVVGSLIAAGIAPEYLAAYSSGRALDDVEDVDGRVARLAARMGGREKSTSWRSACAATTSSCTSRRHRSGPARGGWR
jgi:NTE family protein